MVVQAEWQLIFVVRLAAQCSRLQRGVRKGLCRDCAVNAVSAVSECSSLIGRRLSALCQHGPTQRGTRKPLWCCRDFARQHLEDRSMSRNNATFDAHIEVERIRTRRAEARRKMYRKSRLDKYRAELVAMRQAGASCADLAEWLRVSHRCRMHRSSIDRYLRRLPELIKTAFR